MTLHKSIIYSVVFLSFFLFFLTFQSISIYGGDAGDMVTAAYTGSTAHPPGYPLYSFIGYILSFIPLSTAAWRIGLLSSLAMAGTLTLVAHFIYRLTTSVPSVALASATLASTYLYWLYGIVPEVFALLALFTMALVVVAYHYSVHPSTQKLSLSALLTGLSLTHHHMIIFVFPTVALFLWQQQTFLQKFSLQREARIVGWGIVGLLPYVWAHIAAIRTAPLVWSDPTNLSRFIRLVTRADYGSFQSGVVYGQDIRSRFLQFPATFDFYLNDFTIFGLMLFAVGVVAMWRSHRKVCLPLFVGFLVTGPLFFFYASYLLTSAFFIATAERFLIPSYLFMTIFIGYGMHASLLLVRELTARYSSRLIPLTNYGAIALFAILPIALLITNYPKLSILTYDLTAETFGRDILVTTEPESVLFLQGDHPVFNTQYVYHAYSYRKDVKLIHVTKLLNGTSVRIIQKHYPELGLKEDISDSLPKIHTFIERNYAQFPIYATIPFDLIPANYTWVPIGLLYRLYQEDDLPSYEVVRARNTAAWQSYQDPREGSLGKYKNLMLSNVTDYYRDASVRRGLYAGAYGEDYTGAIEAYDYALALDPERGSIRYLKGDALILLGKCQSALDTYNEALTYRSDDTMLYVDSMIKLYRDCYKDQKLTETWKSKKATLLKKEETSLKEL